MRFLKLAVVGALTASAPSFAKPAQCLIIVNGVTEMSRPCNFSSDKDGSFSIGTDEVPASPIFAYVNLSHNGTAEGWWNGGAGEIHAHDPLGILHRNGGCWENKNARVCAW